MISEPEHVNRGEVGGGVVSEPEHASRVREKVSRGEVVGEGSQ